jgi:16S rRNA C967 or C1407 C5-methylase (RsmB/RsmF family)/NOL1/NOP2/fmu family ribosome biogenesis protein
MTKPSLPNAFIASVHAHFGDQIAERVLKAYEDEPSVAVRLNPRKATTHFNHEQRIPWTKAGFLLSERPNFAYDPHFHAGAYYVQDASSMVLDAILKELSPDKSGIYLDACAAPGGKSTVLLDYLDGQGILVANEVDDRRNSILQENLLKWGALNVATTKLDTSKLTALKGRVQLALIDAPCSGEGMFRKDPFAVEQWSPLLRAQCCATQNDILSNVAPLIKQGGFLVYATCTLNPDENEAQILKWMEQGFEPAQPELKEFQSYTVPATVGSTLIGHYLLPGISLGEGLFISVLRQTAQHRPVKQKRGSSGLKRSSQDPSPFNLPEGAQLFEESDGLFALSGYEHLEGIALERMRPGLPFIQIKGKNVLPLHGAAMIPSGDDAIALTKEESLRYLRREALSLPAESPKGWNLVSFEQIPLGWVKVLEQRANNYYPAWLRLRT